MDIYPSRPSCSLSSPEAACVSVDMWQHVLERAGPQLDEHLKRLLDGHRGQ